MFSMSVEVIHDDFLTSHLLRFYDGNLIKDRDFRHRDDPTATIQTMKRLTSRMRVRVSPTAREMLIRDALDWALSDDLRRRITGEGVYIYLTGTPVPADARR